MSSHKLSLSFCDRCGDYQTLPQSLYKNELVKAIQESGKQIKGSGTYTLQVNHSDRTFTVLEATKWEHNCRVTPVFNQSAPIARNLPWSHPARGPRY